MATTSVLLVTNIPDHAISYEAALSERGYRVRHANDGVAALASALQSPPDCAVIDVRLPDMSGWELCRELKGAEATRETPVVVLTPDTSRAHAEESARVHCTAWIAQPAMADELVRAVDHVLAQPESAPRSPEEAVLGVSICPACESDRVRATLRVSLIQYYRCGSCQYSWRVEAI